MAALHSLTEEQVKWLLILATPKKSALAMNMPNEVQIELVERGFVRILHALPRATAEGKAELMRLMFKRDSSPHDRHRGEAA